MEIKEITKEQREQIKDLLKYYKFANICSKCQIAYGVDTQERIKICPICYSKLHQKK